jgi:hypothetical protein
MTMPAYAHDTIPPATSRSACPVVTRAVGSLPPWDQTRILVRELPAAAFTPEAAS